MSGDGWGRNGPMLDKLWSFTTPEGAMSWWGIEESQRIEDIAAHLRSHGIDPVTWPWDLSTGDGIAQFREWWSERPIASIADWRLALAEIEAMARDGSPNSVSPSSGGRPEWPSWEAMLDVRRLLRMESKQGTQSEVAERLGCDVKTVKRRSQRNGGWPRH
jgi:hypothetical protein